MKIRAFVAGVSDYTKMNEQNLPFCINDISAISNALVNGIGVHKDNIITCGNSGFVTSCDFFSKLENIHNTSDNNDMFIFYFSGHGGTFKSSHYILISDNIINTQDVIRQIEEIPAKNKVIFLDCCMAGDFNLQQTASLNLLETVEEFAGKGYAVLASCNADQVSYGHPNKPISLFTSFLCEAIENPYIIRNGEKSLFDIHKILFLYMEIWNKRNPQQQQHPIFRANMGGTIFFKVQEYHPYIMKTVYEDAEKYIIYDVKPSHTVTAKRYNVKVILKYAYSLEEISYINVDIINKVKKLDIYRSVDSQRRWNRHDANNVFCYFGLDESDIINCNYICHTTWVDENQDRSWWYRLDENSTIINDIHFNIHSYYQNLKIFTKENTGNKMLLITETKIILSYLVNSAEKVIGLYNEYINGTISEQILITKMEKMISTINKYYFDETELPIPPIELNDWSQCCSNLAATIHDFTLFYNKKFISGRSTDNRIACMDMTINRYYNDLEALKKIEQKIQNIN